MRPKWIHIFAAFSWLAMLAVGWYWLASRGILHEPLYFIAVPILSTFLVAEVCYPEK